MVLVAALRKKQSVSLHLCRLGFNLLNCSKHSATALDYACTSHLHRSPAQNADVPPVTQRDSLNRAMQHGDLLTCDQSSFFGFYCHSATIF
jgi:hypothetical protein